ncbi:MAG: hypothetical protein KGI28_06995, partial [Thaumarchaeota archaeon]|nr:hypothetical protein [Nitrososphaerota archaeon]
HVCWFHFFNRVSARIMTKFEDELKNNNFVCSTCQKCQKWVWPPSNFCNKCLGPVIWKSVSHTAKLVEFSSKDGKMFGIAEFEGNIRVFGTITGKSTPKPGDNVVLEHCDYVETAKFDFRIN